MLSPVGVEVFQAYRRDGFVVVRDALALEQCVALAAHLSVLRRRLGLGSDAAIVAVPEGEDPTWSLANRRQLVELASGAIGAPSRCFAVTYLDKAPFVGQRASWHQDGGPWVERLNGAPAATVWVALSDADEESGCLRVVPGSQCLSPQPLAPDPGTLFGVGMDEALVEHSRARTLRVRAGDVVLHHPNVVHASFANQSPRRRSALALRYCAIG